MNDKQWQTRQELRLGIVNWVDTKYNRRRRRRTGPLRGDVTYRPEASVRGADADPAELGFERAAAMEPRPVFCGWPGFGLCRPCRRVQGLSLPHERPGAGATQAHASVTPTRSGAVIRYRYGLIGWPAGGQVPANLRCPLRIP